MDSESRTHRCKEFLVLPSCYLLCMPQRKYRPDVCPECKVREEDSSKKRLFQCNFCERWFCQTHLEPRLAVIRDFKAVIKDATWRRIVEKERRRKDGHPDYAYTWQRLKELKVEKEITRAKMSALLDKSKAYRKPVPFKKEVAVPYSFETSYAHVHCPKCASERLQVSSHREMYVSYECLDCGFNWKARKYEDNARAQTGKFASEGDYHFRRKESTKKPYEKRPSYGRYFRGMNRQIGYISCVICGVVLSIVGLPFAVKYQSTTLPFLGEYQLHSITFLGSPIYTWSTWNAILGPIDFFIAFMLNTLTCFIIFWILTAMR